MTNRIKYSAITGAVVGGIIGLIAGLTMKTWSAAAVGFFGPFVLCLLFGSQSVDAGPEKG